MNSKIITFIIIAALLAGGYFVFTSPNNTEDMTKETVTQQVSNNVSDDVDKETMDDTTMTQEADKLANETYVDYSAEALEEAQTEGGALLFFHASWCPTCKAAESDIVKNGSKLPKDLTILKTNYDKEKDLKEKFGITYQHTFVQVDKYGYNG
ncbi:thioredoxin family protein [Patescibacteria group bacterium]